MPRKVFTVNTAPGTWVMKESKILDGNSMFNSMKIYRATYGSYVTVGKTIRDGRVINVIKSPRRKAHCLIRDSVYKGLLDGTLKLRTQDNETGFVVVDALTGLDTHRIHVGEKCVI